MNTTAATVAAAVRAELARAGLSQRTLAKRLGWSPDYLQRRASGKLAFKVDELVLIALELGVELPKFLETPARPPSAPPSDRPAA